MLSLRCLIQKDIISFLLPNHSEENISQLIKLKVTVLKQMFKRIKPNGKKDFVS